MCDEFVSDSWMKFYDIDIVFRRFEGETRERHAAPLFSYQDEEVSVVTMKFHCFSKHVRQLGIVCV